MQRATGSLINIGASHQTAPIDIREKLSIPPERLADIYREIIGLPLVREVALLSTCNRTEIYAVAEAGLDANSLTHSFCLFQELEPGTLSRYGFEWRDGHAVRHLFDVASGLDSLVVGETEILGQVKTAYSAATEHRTLGPLLNRLFQKSFQAAKWARTHTAIGKGQVSVGTVAVDLALKIFGDLRTCNVLVVGAGEISERTITALKSRGANRISVCNRTDQRAMDLAHQYGGQALPYEQFQQALGQFDIIICSTSSPTPILTRENLLPWMKNRPYQPLFLIDLALPRDIDERAVEVENVFLYNIDDLSQIAEENLALRQAERVRCREMLARRADHFWRSNRR